MIFVTKATLAATGVLILAGTASHLGAQTASHPTDHRIFTPQDIRWSAAPPALPKGAEVAVLYGDPGKEGPFAMRLKFPANYRIPPHTHPSHEIVTVISGTFRVGMGEAADRSKAQVLPAGSLFAYPPGTPHFAYVDEETVIQITTTGPWGLSYVNPNDDPRRQPR